MLPRELTEVGRHLGERFLSTLYTPTTTMGSSTSSRVQYISPEEVAQLVLARPKRDDYLIIGNLSALSSLSPGLTATSSHAHAPDVRSSDFAGGNIPGALNLTTREFGSEQRLSVQSPSSLLLSPLSCTDPICV